MFYENFAPCPATLPGSTATACTVVQWDGVPGFGGVAAPGMTFEAILFDDHQILYQYANMVNMDPTRDNGASSTAGIGQTTGNSLQYSFNSPVLTNGLAIQFTSPLSPVGASGGLAYVPTLSGLGLALLSGLLFWLGRRRVGAS